MSVDVLFPKEKKKKVRSVTRKPTIEELEIIEEALRKNALVDKDFFISDEERSEVMSIRRELSFEAARIQRRARFIAEKNRDN